MRYLVLFVLIGGCGPDDQPVTQDDQDHVCRKASGSTVSCEFKGVTLSHSGNQSSCEMSWDSYAECGLSERDILGCRSAIKRCNPQPAESCAGERGNDWIGCMMPECDAFTTCTIDL